jgi:hypothetical protein
MGTPVPSAADLNVAAVSAPNYTIPESEPQSAGDDDSLDWSLWLPLVCSLVGVTACCAVAMVSYCWYQLRNTLSPTTALRGASFNFRGAFESAVTGATERWAGHQDTSTHSNR